MLVRKEQLQVFHYKKKDDVTVLLIILSYDIYSNERFLLKK